MIKSGFSVTTPLKGDIATNNCDMQEVKRKIIFLQTQDLCTRVVVDHKTRNNKLVDSFYILINEIFKDHASRWLEKGTGYNIVVQSNKNAFFCEGSLSVIKENIDEMVVRINARFFCGVDGELFDIRSDIRGKGGTIIAEGPSFVTFGVVVASSEDEQEQRLISGWLDNWFFAFKKMLVDNELKIEAAIKGLS